MMKFVLLAFLLAQTAKALTIDEYLAEVRKKNRIYSSVDLSIDASNARREAGDLVLAPQLTAAYGITVDKTVPSSVAETRKDTGYTLGVSKKFSTGTSLGLSARDDHFEYTNPLTGQVPDSSASGLGVTLQQSLWKDFFGQGTRYRHEREQALNNYETLSYELKRRNVMLEAESSFWDYTVAVEDLKLKQENFERAKRLDRWTSGRVNNGISDRADLMNVRALMASRELQLQTATDNLKTEEIRFRENLDLAVSDPTPPIESNLAQERPYLNQLLDQKNMILIDSYLTALDAKTRKLSARELADTLKPDLALVGAYNTSAFDPAGNSSHNDIAKTDHPRTYVGLSFTWLFDTSAKSAQIAAYDKDAAAAQYQADKKLVEGRIAWAELVRKYRVNQETVKTLEKIAGFQKERVKAEQDKFAKGRTITTNVVTAETDSAEADVVYLRAPSGLRKMEASTLLYTNIQE